MSLDSTKLEITRTSTPTELLPKDKLVFGKTFTDHMLEVEWTLEDGWSTPKISPYHALSLDPASVVFHYSFELFEGMKAYRDASGNVRTFRPDQNMARMNRSAKRAALPQFDGEELMKCIDKLLLVEDKFVPSDPGYSLYLRPTLIGTTSGLGVARPDRALLFVIASPVGPYFAGGFKPVSLEATDYAVRAWPGGVGNCKLGSNYVSCIEPQTLAATRGHQQNLWLFGEEGYITEVGAMNVFFVFVKDGKYELVTPPLDGTILPGVTRDSALQLAREKLDSSWEINERKVTIHEVQERASKNEVVEAFGTGTAAIVAPINNIEYRGTQIAIPTSDAGDAGPTAKKVAEWVRQIQYGEIEFKDWSRVAH